MAAMLAGNPAQPALQTDGIFQSPPSWWSFRVAFLEDFVYRCRFKDEEKLEEGLVSNKSFLRLSTNAGMLTFNVRNRADFYGILGSTKLQLDREIYTKGQFSWGIGTKIIIFRTENFFFSTDFKYFEFEQEPLYFVSEGLAYNLVDTFKLQYSEWQGSLGLSYKNGCICPYLFATYIQARIEPQPKFALVRMPHMNVVADVPSESVVNHRHLGLALGATITAASKTTLTVESRMFNQNAIDVNLEIRF
jgi:hypothetical protein